ncbi:acyltransferase [Desulfosporosinus fructosivorans]|uniref:Acyltransferase n=1 Tax=Desulfosporosinus fructosivorans TaxID=2018669 RepID=A0A4Z0RBJ2_9FIRM|nr:acyltransferase [Desulfosporosinus fructosivorans]TGE39537.1 acyltransferase [Desulfosporosinus fructosivorans]
MDQKKIVHMAHKTIEEINYLRGFGVLAVIAIHTTGYFTEIKSYSTLVIVNLWTDVFSQFAVPLFILISGVVLARNYRSNFSLTEFYKKRIRSIIPQYLIFSILYTLFNNWAVMQGNPLSANLALLLNNLVHANASYHLWFFSIIIQLYILYPIIIKIYDLCKRIDRAEVMIAMLLIMQILWMVGLHSSSFPFIKLNFMSFLFYFGLGIYIVDYFDSNSNQLTKASKHLTLVYLITSLALTIGASFFIIIGLKTGYDYYSIPAYFFIGSELIYPVLRITTFLLLLNLATSLVEKRSLLAKVIYRIGDYSFGIYLIHIFFNQYAIKILKNNAIDYNNWAFYPIVFVTTVVFSYLVVRLLSYVPYSYYIIGRRNPKSKIRI